MAGQRLLNPLQINGLLLQMDHPLDQSSPRRHLLHQQQIHLHRNAPHMERSYERQFSKHPQTPSSLIDPC
jgi:hypothetical protein